MSKPEKRMRSSLALIARSTCPTGDLPTAQASAITPQSANHAIGQNPSGFANCVWLKPKKAPSKLSGRPSSPPVIDRKSVINTNERNICASANVNMANGSGRARTINAPIAAESSVEASRVKALAAMTFQPNSVIAIA